MTQLHLARGLSLDADYVGGGTFALLAKKGAGKTYTGRVMCEEFWKAKVPFVALDPMDAWWGLRSSADGEGEGIPVAIFGGEHGDAPLERTSGKLMADLAVDEGLSMVLSLKHLGSRSAERQFALDFLERLYRRNSELVHLLIDEADLFAPQRPQAGDQPLLGVTENIVRRGRNSGIGVTLITQRPAVLNKDVLSQVDGLVVMRIVGKHDRDAIDEWVKGGHAEPEEAAKIKPTLASLANGECWWWVPELDVLEHVQVRKSRTFDSSPTRKRGDKTREPKSFADVDMGAIETKMAETIERAKADDPRALRKKIIELEQLVQKQDRGLTKPKAEVVVEEKIVEKTVEVPVFDGAFDKLPGAVASLREIAEGFEAGLREARRLVDQASAARAEVVPARPARRDGAQAARPAAAVRRTPAPRPPQEPREPVEIGDFRISGPQQRILDSLAWFESIGVEPRRPPLAALAGSSSKSSGFEKNLSTLKTAGLIDYPDRGRVHLTDAGRDVATPPAATPTDDELHEAIFRMVSGPQATILRVLIGSYPDALAREDLAEQADASVLSSGFEKNLSTLRSFELIEYPQRGYVVALPVLFVEGVPA